MRSCPGWQEADFVKFKAWIADVFYPHITKFYISYYDKIIYGFDPNIMKYKTITF